MNIWQVEMYRVGDLSSRILYRGENEKSARQLFVSMQAMITDRHFARSEKKINAVALRCDSRIVESFEGKVTK